MYRTSACPAMRKVAETTVHKIIEKIQMQKEDLKIINIYFKTIKICLQHTKLQFLIIYCDIDFMKA